MKAYLVLENGQIFEGEHIGAEKSAVGELVFNTGMVGYLETLCDPCYSGQIVMQTFPMIGNYGVINEDVSSDAVPSAYVVREICDSPSNFRCDGKLEDYLREKGIPGICGVDTRALTRLLRSEGTMNAALVFSPDEISAEEIAAYRVKKPCVCDKVKGEYPVSPEKARVALINYGARKDICGNLALRGVSVTVYSPEVKAEEILSGGFSGVVLSGGAGDPADFAEEIGRVKALLGKLPVFGIGLGHQLLWKAAGAETVKLKFGHRGQNQPVRDLQGERTFITSQNHGYAVDGETLPEGAYATYANVNDNSLEGAECPTCRAMGVQFFPEANSGPHDTSFIYDRFIELMEV